jgi:hypothetical protein
LVTLTFLYIQDFSKNNRWPVGGAIAESPTKSKGQKPSSVKFSDFN